MLRSVVRRQGVQHRRVKRQHHAGNQLTSLFVILREADEERLDRIVHLLRGRGCRLTSTVLLRCSQTALQKNERGSVDRSTVEQRSRFLQSGADRNRRTTCRFGFENRKRQSIDLSEATSDRGPAERELAPLAPPSRPRRNEASLACPTASPR